MGKAPNLDDYNDVASRMAEFFSKYPEGSLKGNFQFQTIGDRDAVVFRAQAFRTAADPAPGDGHAIEFIPGSTPYTKDSELQNAETAAWGRAIMAVGASDSKKGIASREEVRNRIVEPPVSPTAEGTSKLLALCEENGWQPSAIAEVFQERMGTHPRFADNDQLLSFVNLVRSGAVAVNL